MAILARRCLITIGKVLPFFLCLLVFISYAESAFSLATSDYLYYDGYYIVNTPISFAIGLNFEYDLLAIFVTFVTSVAIRACKWNVYAIFYLFVNLCERSCYNKVEMECSTIYIISLLNIIITLLLIYKGVKAFNVK